MTLAALLLILASAVLHATWNLLAKRVGGGAAFTWLFGMLTILLYAPGALVLIMMMRPSLGLLELSFVMGGGIIHLGYFLSLQRGYREGDLSLVYPLARGTGPLLATVGAVTLFAERPTTLALVGAGLIITSVFIMAGGDKMLTRASRPAGSAIGYGLLTGVFIAGYTLWDAYAVRVLLIAPLLYYWLSEIVRAALLTPVALRRWQMVREHWRMHKLELFGVAVLSPLSYILVLLAFTLAPVSYVAPAREISILVGALLGARFLAEGDTRRRLLAAVLMMLGVVALSIG